MTNDQSEIGDDEIGAEMTSSRDYDTEAVFDIDESTVASPHSGDVTYFGTDFDVHGLVRRLDDGDIVVPSFDPEVEFSSGIEGFQRRFVWSKPQMDRFIESLLLGYPVPGVFMVQEPDQRLLVLDGQQRLKTLQSFYKGVTRERIFRLENVDSKFGSQTYEELIPEYRRLLDNTFIHATIVRHESNTDADSVYQIFERLNTGGTNLQPHEIRTALFHGPLIRLLRDLNHKNDWRALYGQRSIRLKDQELILRFFALRLDSDKYQRPLKKFLNDFTERNRDLEGWNVDSRSSEFENVTSTILATLGDRAFRLANQVNAALCDALMVAYADRLQSPDPVDPDKAKTAYKELLEEKEFITAVTRATADEDSVGRRLRLARSAFSEV
jgi:hypothetical protein